MTRPVASVVVLGAGPAGLAAAATLAERGAAVELVSLGPPARSAAALAWAGMPRATSDADVQSLLDHAVAHGEGLAHRALLATIASEIPRQVACLTQLGVPWIVDEHGDDQAHVVFDAAGFGRSTQLALDDHVRAFEMPPGRGTRAEPGRVLRRESHELVALAVTADGCCVGAIVRDLTTGEVEPLASAAVILATGGYAASFGASTGLVDDTGGPIALAAAAGAALTHVELVAFEPAVLGDDKPLWLAGCLLGEGFVVWHPKDVREKRRPGDIPRTQRTVVFEHEAGTVAPRPHVLSRLLAAAAGQADDDPVEATRAGNAIYVSLTDVGTSVRARLGRERIARISGRDPSREPLPVMVAPHATLGGLWVDAAVTGEAALAERSNRHLATSLLGLFAAGDAAGGIHGAVRLPGLGWPTALATGQIAARAAWAHAQSVTRDAAAAEAVRGAYAAATEAIAKRGVGVGQRAGAAPSPALRAAIEAGAGVLRNEAGLSALDEQLCEMATTAARTTIGDAAHLGLARAVAAAARARRETRGVHTRTDAPEVDDTLNGAIVVRLEDGIPTVELPTREPLEGAR